MKTFVAAGAIFSTALLSPALAADLPVKAKPAPVASNWTGFYLFGGGGYGLSSADVQTMAPFPLVSNRTGGHGYFGTVGGGYDWQFAPSWVAGIFADAQFGDIKTVLQPYDGIGGFATGTAKNNTSYAVGARLGYLIAPNALTYVNGGYSHADFTGADLYDQGMIGNPAFLFATTGRQHRDGWFVGGGVEHSLDLFGLAAPGWFMKTEYRLAEYGKTTIDIPAYGNIYPTTFKPYVQTASTSLVYRFNSGVTPSSAPLYAKAPAASPVGWSGFYLSGGGGYGLWDADVGKVAPGGTYPNQHHTGGRGWFGTVGGGYDWQFAPRWVAGVLADAQFGDIKGSIIDPFQNYPGSTKNNLNYAVGARLGYLVAPNVLSYINGGYSHADFTQASLNSSDGTPLAFPYTIVKQHHDGWFVGGGVENSLNPFGIAAPGWFMKTEYRLASYGRQNITLIPPSGQPDGNFITFKPTVQTISTSLVYRFN